MALIKKIISVVKNVEKFEHSYTAGVNGNQFLEVLNTELPYDPGILLRVVYAQGKWKHASIQKLVPKCSQSCSSYSPKLEEPRCPRMDERVSKMWSIHTRSIVQPLKGMKY